MTDEYTDPKIFTNPDLALFCHKLVELCKEYDIRIEHNRDLGLEFIKGKKWNKLNDMEIFGISKEGVDLGFFG